MKRVLFILSCIIVISCLFVSATMVLNFNGSYDVEVFIYEGWNIVAATLPEEGISEDSEIKLGDIKAAWLFTTKFGELSPSGEYVRAYPNPDLDRIHQNDDTEMIRNAMWIYSKKNGVLKYNTLENYKSLDDRLLYSGWNFAVIDPMVAKTLYEKNVGTCDIEKSYFYNAESQEWVRYSLNDLFNEIDGPEDEDFIGLGWVIKVSDDCNLGSSGNVDGPPGLPNGDGDSDEKPLEYPNEVGDYILEKVPNIEKGCAPANNLGPRLGIDIEDTVCIEGATFNYYNKNDEESNKRGVFLTIARFDQGKDVYKNRILSVLTLTENEGVYGTGEPWELYWWSDNFYIVIQEYVQKPSPNGFSYSYSATATIEHPITNWFITKYQPK